MRLAHTVEARQQQAQRIDPRQILASEILALAAVELEAIIERELSENPALEARDSAAFEPRLADPAPPLPALTMTGGTEYAPAALFAVSPRLHPTPVVGGAWEEEIDPLERVAGGVTLRDHLRSQIGRVAGGHPCLRPVIAFLIESLDERGYLCADPDEVAERFRCGRGGVERAITALQAMDPPGVGARDLRECLLLQTDHLEQTGEAHPLARRLLTLCWDDLIARRDDRIAARLRVPAAEVRIALRWLRATLAPHPGASFRPEWSARVGGGEGGGGAAIRPDIVFRRTEAGFVVELARDHETTLSVGPLWAKLAEKPDAAADEAMRRYIREHVDRAQSFLAGLARRGQTLRRIAAELTERQQGFLMTGERAFLRPLTRQTLADALGLDESVISRAVAEKWAQLPTGDVVPLDAFFGNAHAVRDALATLVAGEDPSAPYSDDEIADLLTAQGFPLARRTVAKYRGLEKILPARLRRRRGPAEKAA